MPDVQIISLADMSNRVVGTCVLDPGVRHTILVDESSLRGSHQLIVLRGDDSDLVAGLRNWGSVIQALDSCTIGTNVIASSAAKGMENLADRRTRGIAKEVGKIIDVSKGSSVGRRRNGRNLVHQVGHTLELGDIEGLEGAFGVADQIDLGLAGLLGNLLDVGSDFGGTFVDGLQTTDEWESIVSTIRLRVCAVALGLEPGLHEVQVFIIGGTQSMKEDNGVGRTVAREIIDPECECSGCRKGREGQPGN